MHCLDKDFEEEVNIIILPGKEKRKKIVFSNKVSSVGELERMFNKHQAFVEYPRYYRLGDKIELVMNTPRLGKMGMVTGIICNTNLKHCIIHSLLKLYITLKEGEEFKTETLEVIDINIIDFNDKYVMKKVKGF